MPMLIIGTRLDFMFAICSMHNYAVSTATEFVVSHVRGTYAIHQPSKGDV